MAPGPEIKTPACLHPPFWGGCAGAAAGPPRTMAKHGGASILILAAAASHPTGTGQHPREVTRNWFWTLGTNQGAAAG